MLTWIAFYYDTLTLTSPSCFYQFYRSNGGYLLDSYSWTVSYVLIYLHPNFYDAFHLLMLTWTVYGPYVLCHPICHQNHA
ncbi:hypothetical protein HanXRQr2_Chr01g0033681 [Helianthus annuus]|uniref:Uncharacterized protein n=1 Tax=Helianthus annuus TaxID=4232 RepID=A0A9K3JX01_HELAN|nr:hypothetical protein HanXRQr2_Chr01g0033681 [Helianthus annuus]